MKCDVAWLWKHGRKHGVSSIKFDRNSIQTFPIKFHERNFNETCIFFLCPVRMTRLRPSTVVPKRLASIAATPLTKSTPIKTPPKPATPLTKSTPIKTPPKPTPPKPTPPKPTPPPPRPTPPRLIPGSQQHSTRAQSHSTQAFGPAAPVAPPPVVPPVVPPPRGLPPRIP